jgi:hypothetical protein
VLFPFRDEAKMTTTRPMTTIAPTPTAPMSNIVFWLSPLFWGAA